MLDAGFDPPVRRDLRSEVDDPPVGAADLPVINVKALGIKLERARAQAKEILTSGRQWQVLHTESCWLQSRLHLLVGYV